MHVFAPFSTGTGSLANAARFDLAFFGFAGATIGVLILTVSSFVLLPP